MKRLLVCVVVCLLVCSSAAWAQTAQIAGRVADQTGAVVPGAKVVVMNEGTSTSRSVDTDNVGLYVVPSLMPGNYTVSVQLNGFRPVVRNGVTLEVGQNARLDFLLEAASTQEALTVSADASHINVSDGSVGMVIDRRFVENIPMNGRSFQSLILLTPGAITNSPQTSSSLGNSGDISINGQRTEANRYTVDGVSANNGTGLFGTSTNGTGGGLASGTALGTTHGLVSLDALQEFRVSTSSYSAEYGRSPGGQFSFVTRSGTNGWHGSLFDYVRNDSLDANDWFNSRFGVAKPSERQSDFGGTLGGPLRIPRLYDGRDRTFFFFSYEGLRVRQPLAATLQYVPSLDLRQQAPIELRDALNAFPLPTGANQPNGLAEYLMTDSLPSELDSTSIRVDHNLGSATRLFFRYSDTSSKITARSVGYHDTKQLEPKSLTFGATTPLSNRFNNDVRISYSPNRGSDVLSYVTGDGVQPADLFKAQGIDRSANPQAFVVVGLYFPGSTNQVGISSVGQKQSQWNLVDTVDFIAGRHQLRAGIDFLQTRSTLQNRDPTINVLFDSAANVIANRGFSAGVARYQKTQPVFTNIGAFVQDEWRLASRLALSLGVRWEVAPPPDSANGLLPRVITGTPSDITSLGVAPEGQKLWQTTYNNIAPRVGLAYVVRDVAQYETVLRTGAGIFYDNIQSIRPAAFENNPGISTTRNYGTNFGSVASFPLTASQLNVSLADSLLPPYASAYQFGNATDPLVLPYTFQGNVSVEQGLGSRQSLTLSYVGARGRRLLERDLWSYGAARSPSFPFLNVISNGATSSYDALQTQLQRRLSHGVQALVSYTWSHAIDYGSINGSQQARRGDADFDVRHNFNAAVTYEIPMLFTSPIPHTLLDRWSLDARFTARSAFPVTLSGNLLTLPNGSQLPGGLDVVTGVPFYVDRPDLPGGRQINPAAFKLPTAGSFGNAPRNFVRGFGATQLDAVLRRDFPLYGASKLQFRFEVFNVLNHPNFGVVNSTFGNPQFGQATKMLNSSLGGLSALYQQGGPRSMQVSLRFAF